MKGFAHFMSGLAVTSCFPPAVAAAEQGNPLYFILGGVFALLPDTLDFKVLRYFYRHDVEVAPDPLAPDPQMIADAIAGAIDTAAIQQKYFRIKLHTIRLSADRWQRYLIHFDTANRQVSVSITDIVDTGGNPETGTAYKPVSAAAAFSAPLRLDYTAETRIDIFDGPHFQMTPARDGTVTPEFIPWHRQQSHSFLTGLFFAIPVGLLWGPLAGTVVASAYAAHIVLDQLGYMGSNLFWPITHRRVPGLKLQHSAKSTPNLTMAWGSALLIYWNLACNASNAVTFPNPFRLFVLAGIIPFALLMLLRRQLRKEPAPRIIHKRVQREEAADEATG